MDKVGMKSTQAQPLWERTPTRGHRSAVDGALKAHRQRSLERHQRTQDRIDMMDNVKNDFFPGPQMDTYSPMNNQSSRNMSEPLNMENIQSPRNMAQGQNSEVQSSMDPAAIMIQPEIDNVPLNPRGMEDIYRDAQLGSVKNQALGEVEQEIENPNHGPVDDMPKGSYVDYEV